MKLKVTLKGYSRSNNERVHLETTFRDACISYYPSVEKIKDLLSGKDKLEYHQMLIRGWCSVNPFLTYKEKQSVKVKLEVK